MAKIPFDIKYRRQIESGEYIVIDRFDYKLHFVKEEDGVFFFTVRYPGCNYDTERLYDHPERNLFIVTPEEELTEFEGKVKQLIGTYPVTTMENRGSLIYEVRKAAAELLVLAREQLIKDGYVIEKKALHDTVEKAMREE